MTKTNSYGNRQKRVFRIVRPIQVLRTFDPAGNIKKELELRSVVGLQREGDDEIKNASSVLSLLGIKRTIIVHF